MKLAKQQLDIGLFTNNIEAMLAFWQGEVGLPYEEGLPTGGGNMQHRHGLNGAVLKVNHSREPLPDLPPAGYDEILIARDGLEAPRSLVDPDGNRATLVPPGHLGVTTAGVVVAVTSLAAAERYYGEALQFERTGPGTFRAGETVLILREDPGRETQQPMRARGIRYLTVQVWDCSAEMEGIVARGGEMATAARTMGSVARFGFVRDPDGNWLEVSQRASLTGPLPTN